MAGSSVESSAVQNRVRERHRRASQVHEEDLGRLVAVALGHGGVLDPEDLVDASSDEAGNRRARRRWRGAGGDKQCSDCDGTEKGKCLKRSISALFVDLRIIYSFQYCLASRS